MTPTDFATTETEFCVQRFNTLDHFFCVTLIQLSIFHIVTLTSSQSYRYSL